LENIVINFEVNNEQLLTTLDLLKKTGQITQADADRFKTLGQSSQQAVKQIQTPIATLNKEVKDLGSNVAKAFVLDTTQSISKTVNGFKSLKTEIREATADAIALGRKFGELSPQAIEAQKRVAKLKDEFGDTQKRIEALNPDARFKGLSQTIGGLAGAFAGVTGAIQLFGGETKEAEAIARKFQGALNIVQGLNALGELGDSLNSIKAALGLTTVATVAQTTATEGLAVATASEAVAAEGAAVATKSFTAALLTNPITIAVAAIAALAGAYYLLKDNANGAEQAITELNGTLAEISGTEEARARRAKNEQNDIQNNIALLKAKGASEKEIAEAELKFQQNRKLNFEIEKSQIEENLKLLEKRKQNILSKDQTEDTKKAIEDINSKYDAESKRLKDLPQDVKDAQAQIDIINAKYSFDQQKRTEERQKKELENEKAIAAEKTRIASKAADDEFAFQLQLLEGQQAIELAQYDLNEREKLAIQIKYAEKRRDLIFNTNYDKVALQKANDEIAKLNAQLNAQIKKDAEDTTKALAEQSQKRTKQFTDDELKKREAIVQTLELIQQGAGAIGDIFSALSERALSDIETQRDAKLESDDKEIEALRNKFDKGLIGQKAYDAELKKLENKKQADQKKFEAQITEEKRKQAILNKELALFNIAINTAQAIIKLPADGGFLGLAAIPAMIALGVAQAAAVLAAPLPKFHKGRLAQLDSSEQHAIIRKDETIFNPQQSRDYAPTFSAIYHGKIKPGIINDYVNLKLKGGNVSSTIDTHKLAYDIAYALRDQNKVYVKNMGELAKAIAENIPQPDPRKW
jgi:hypothetical protein